MWANRTCGARKKRELIASETPIRAIGAIAPPGQEGGCGVTNSRDSLLNAPDGVVVQDLCKRSSKGFVDSSAKPEESILGVKSRRQQELGTRCWTSTVQTQEITRPRF